jgi:uncharacterized protein YneF (UPF0154 family)
LPVIKVIWNKEVKNMEIAVAILGIGFTLLAFIITYLAWRNGKIIKENTKIVIDKIDELGQKMDNGFKVIAQKIDEGFRKMDEGFRLIALLILAETPEEKDDIAKKSLKI